MTKEDIKTKTKELLEAHNKVFLERLDSLLRSGAINENDHNDDYRLPRVILCAIQESMISELKPLSKQYKEELENIRHFV